MGPGCDRARGARRVGAASLLPSSLVAERRERPRGTRTRPYTLTPASANPVNERIVFGDLPEGVAMYETSNDFVFVTVTAPSQSVLSWLTGRNEAAVSFMTEEDKYGVRTPSQRREFNLQMMRTAEQEAQYVGYHLATTSRSPPAMSSFRTCCARCPATTVSAPSGSRPTNRSIRPTGSSRPMASRWTRSTICRRTGRQAARRHRRADHRPSRRGRADRDRRAVASPDDLTARSSGSSRSTRERPVAVRDRHRHR